MSKKEKKRLERIVASALFLTLAILLNKFFVGDDLLVKLASMSLFFVSYIIVAGDVLTNAFNNIRRGRVFDENFLMSIATIGAILLQQYAEGVAVMLFYQIGELFQSFAVQKSRNSISELMDIRPDYANVEREGELVKVDPESLKIGDVVVVLPGERVPVDGLIIEGKSSVDAAALTGESLPVTVAEGSNIQSASVNISGRIKVRVEKEFYDSAVSKILELVEEASDKKSGSEKFITKFAAVYTPIVVYAALALAFIPPLFFGASYFSELPVWINRSLIFLVVSCPCALVISVPLSFFGGIGGASSEGILIKGGNYIEKLAKAKTVVFDKTGTLTNGEFEVVEIRPFTKHICRYHLLELAAYAESASNHPIALSIIKAFESSHKRIDKNKIESLEDVPGRGIRVVLDGVDVKVGNSSFMIEEGIADFNEDEKSENSSVFIAKDGRYLGQILLADSAKSGAKIAIEAIKSLGVNRVAMLSGDRREIAENIAHQVGIDEVYAELLPADKMKRLEQMIAESNGSVIYVGDGINDAPSLTLADAGIAMGGLGQDAAIEAADVVIMNDNIFKIAQAIMISKKTNGIAWQNVSFALGIKLGVLLLASLGLANMWGAVFADVGVAVIAILNAIRCLKTPSLEHKNSSKARLGATSSSH